MFVFYALLEDKRAPKHVFGFGIGMVVLFGTLAFGPYTGAGINPMRVFGP